MLAANPEALRVVVAEVDAVVAGNGGRLPSTMAEVAQLTVGPGRCRSPRHRMPYADPIRFRHVSNTPILGDCSDRFRMILGDFERVRSVLGSFCPYDAVCSGFRVAV
jgi:hypothetical protein